MWKTLRAPFLLFNVNSLEARVPFGDLDFVKYVMALDPSFKQNIYGKRNLLPEFLQTTGTAENKPENCLHYESPLSLLFPLVFLFFYLTILSPILQLNSASIRLQYHYRVINKNHRKTLLIGYIHLSIQIFAVPCYDRKRRPQNCFDIISDSINILFSTCLSSWFFSKKDWQIFFSGV